METKTKTKTITAATVVNPITRPTSHKMLADAIVNRFKGVAAIDLTNEMGEVLSESDLKKKGCVFATIHVSRNLASTMRAKHRITGEVCPFTVTGRGKNKIQPTMMAIETYKVQVLLNTIWQNVVNNKVEKVTGDKGEFVASKTKTNRIGLHDKDCRVVGYKEKDGEETFYTNYIIFNYLSKRVVKDEHGRELDTKWLDGFAKTSKDQKAESEKREALKHGLSVKDDPKYRNMKFENIRFISMFGTDYIPLESATVVMNVKTPVSAQTK